MARMTVQLIPEEELDTDQVKQRIAEFNHKNH